MSKLVIPIKDFIVMKRSLSHETRVLLPETIDKGNSGMFTFKVIDMGPDVKSVKVGDSLVTSAGLFKTEVDGEEFYFTKEELVCLIVREKE